MVRGTVPFGLLMPLVLDDGRCFARLLDKALIYYLYSLGKSACMYLHTKTLWLLCVLRWYAHINLQNYMNYISTNHQHTACSYLETCVVYKLCSFVICGMSYLFWSRCNVSHFITNWGDNIVRRVSMEYCITHNNISIQSRILLF